MGAFFCDCEIFTNLCLKLYPAPATSTRTTDSPTSSDSPPLVQCTAARDPNTCQLFQTHKCYCRNYACPRLPASAASSPSHRACLPARPWPRPAASATCPLARKTRRRGRGWWRGCGAWAPTPPLPAPTGRGGEVSRAARVSPPRQCRDNSATPPSDGRCLSPPSARTCASAPRTAGPPSPTACPWSWGW